MTACQFAAIGWVIAIIIAIYANQQANKRETRKETREKLNQLNTCLSSLVDAANNYYLNYDSLCSKEIIRIHEAINTGYRLIEDIGNTKKGIKLHVHFCDLYELVTGGDFESNQHQAGSQFTELCKEIAAKKESLIIESEAWFNKTFQS